MMVWRAEGVLWRWWSRLVCMACKVVGVCVVGVGCVRDGICYDEMALVPE